MSSVAVRTTSGDESFAPSAIQQLERFGQRIRRRAYDIFEHRGADGSATEDWLQAERELMLMPESEIIEKSGKYEIRIAAPVFKAEEIEVTALPNAVVVSADSMHTHAENEASVQLCELERKSLYRRFELREQINPEKVNANLSEGVLHVNALKAAKAERAAAAGI